MLIKLFGAALIIAGCGGVGLYMCICHKREEEVLQQLIAALDYMGCELQYRMTPLPDLCRSAAAQSKGVISMLFQNLACELDSQISPDASACMAVALKRTPKIPESAYKLLVRLGGSLGRFDMSGQIKGLEYTRQQCRKLQEELSKDSIVRMRGYQTLALCVGVALAILFL